MTPSPETPDTPSRQMQQLRDVRDLTDQILGQMSRVEHQLPFANLLIRIKWGIGNLSSDLDTYVYRLECAAAQSTSSQDGDVLPQADLAQFTRDLLAFAEWLDHLEDVG